MRIGAIDQGTTSTRILVVDGADMRVALSRSHTTRYPKPGWVEQDALEILANIRACVAAAGPLDALGLANQGESCLAWDAETGEPLSPVIVWQDSRTALDLARLSPAASARVATLAHLPLDAYFSGSKLGWLLQNVPAVAAAGRAGRLRLGTSDAFYLERLGGTFATDRATASRTSLMNFETGLWDPELCQIFGVPIDYLPPILPNIANFGSVDGVPIRASIVDQQAALYGHGCRAAGDLKITFGTGAFALTLTDKPIAAVEARGLLPTVAWDLGDGVRYALDGGVYDVGSAINWALRAGLAESLAEFQHFESTPAIARGLVFVPAFSGLAAPYWDRSAAPLIIGMSPETTRRDLCQALIEGIVLSTAAIVDSMASVVPVGDLVSIDGGVSQSPYFAQFLSNCLAREIVVRHFPEQTAIGVSMMATGDQRVTQLERSVTDRVFYPRASEGVLHRRRYAEAASRAREWRMD